VEVEKKVFVWEDDLLRNCCLLLYNIVLHDGVLDHWKWLLDPIKGFSVTDVYHLFTTSDQINERVNTVNIWHKHVLLKVSIFVWCLFCNCLPTKDNLITREIIQAKANVCVGGYEVQESTEHLFITCSHFGQLWMQIRSWLGVSSVDTF